MFPRKVLLAAAGMLLGLTPLYAIHGAPANQATGANTMNVLVESAPSDLDPASSYDENSNIPLRGVYEGLVTLKGDSLSDVVPVLAEKIDNQSDTVFTFHLRQNVKFHDGTAFDAAAAKFGLTRTVTVNLGTQAILGTFLNEPDKQIKVVDPATLQITFDHPQPFFLIALAASYGTGFVSPAAVAAHTAKDSSGVSDNAHGWLGRHEAGTGPYMLSGDLPSGDDMANGKPITLKQFPGYWGGWAGSHFDQVVIKVQEESALRRRALETGAADAATVLLPQDIAQLKADNKFQFDPKPTLRIDYLIMAASYGPLANVKARQAMTYAFDYAAYNQAELGSLGTQAVGPFPSTLLGWDNSAFAPKTDLKKALQLLTEAGVAPGTALTYAAPVGRGDQAGAILKQQLEQIGLTLTIKKFNQDDYNALLIAKEIKPDRPDFFLQAWWPDYNSPLNYSYPLFYSQSAGANGQNAGYYTDPTVDKLIDQGSKGTSVDQIVAPFKQAQQILSKDDPAGIFMAQSPDRTVVSAAIKNQVFNVLYLGTFDFYAISRS